MSETNEESLERMHEGGQGGPVDTLVTIASFPDPVEASLARTALESAGILSFLQGENANTLIPVAFTARLQVRTEDEQAAYDVLRSAELAPDFDERLTAAEPEGGETAL